MGSMGMPYGARPAPAHHACSELSADKTCDTACVRLSASLDRAGMQAMLKDGHQMFSGLDEAVLKNIDACKQLSLLTKTSMGPNGDPPPLPPLPTLPVSRHAAMLDLLGSAAALTRTTVAITCFTGRK